MQPINLMDVRAGSIEMLLQMQNANNKIQHSPTWVLSATDERPDHRMALIELAEVWDHLPSGQWWKRGGTLEQFLNEQEREQAALEIVDAIHFAFSHALRLNYLMSGTGKPISAILPKLARDIAEASLEASVIHEEFLRRLPTTSSEGYELAEFNALIDTAILNVNFQMGVTAPQPYCLDTLQLGQKQVTSFDFFWCSVFRALYILDYSFDQFVALYVAKNVLNGFRVRNGYTKKEGLDRYIKRAPDGPQEIVSTEAHEGEPVYEAAEVEDNWHLPAIAARVAKEGLPSDKLAEAIESDLAMIMHKRWVWVLETAAARDSAESRGLACSMKEAYCDRFLEPVNGWKPQLIDRVTLIEGEPSVKDVQFVHESGDMAILYVGYHPGFHTPVTKPGNETESK